VFTIDPLKILLVLVVALLLLGPERIPAAAHKLSSFLKDLQRLRSNLHSQVRNSLEGTPLEDLARHGELLEELRKLDSRKVIDYLSSSAARSKAQPEGADPTIRESTDQDSAPSVQPVSVQPVDPGPLETDRAGSPEGQGRPQAVQR